VAQVVIEEERARQALERRCAAAEAELAELRELLKQDRSRGLRAVSASGPPAPSAFAVQASLVVTLNPATT